MDKKLKCDIFIEKQMKSLWEMSKYIHANPEVAFTEYKACKSQCDYLKENGFRVKQGIGSLETAFKASYKKGKHGPIIAVISEYDALDIGHACGHNLIAASALGSAIGVKNFLENNDIDGEICVIGTPAEERGGGKIILLREGVFEGTDAVFMMHPTSSTSRLAGECLSSNSFNIKFLGKTSHASAHPDNGINALSAANLFCVAIGMLRQHFKSDVRISCIITNGGIATNLIPDTSELMVQTGCFNTKNLDDIANQINQCANGVAVAMGCDVNIIVTEGYKGRVSNKILSDICKRELDELHEDYMEGLPIDYGGEDLGNISRVIPICNPYISIFTDHKISNHTQQFKELSISKNGYHCIEISSKVMARSIIELFCNTKIIDLAKLELNKKLEKE